MNSFKARSSAAMADPALGATVRRSTSLLESRRKEAASALDGFERMRERARQDKLQVLGGLAALLARFEEKVQANGGQVHWAGDGAQAAALIAGILKARGVSRAVKSKSMVTEEIHLNKALERSGIEAVETDLGEYVAQLRQEPPSHIILPILHLTRQAVGALFRSRKVGAPAQPGDDVASLVEAARVQLRSSFETAQAGISGANFALAEEGALCIVSNEGNARFCTTLPKIHIAVLGIEKLIPGLSSLPTFLRLLARSATGQRLTVYSNLIWPGRQAGDGSGPHESHVILLDNGRTSLLQSPAAEILACIRCGACLNSCPIFKAAGGHAYGSTYPGPMGSILSPGLGRRQGRDLALASTLCGACKDACPVKIDIPRMLLYYRGQGGVSKGGWAKAAAFRAYGLLASRPALLGRLMSLVRRPLSLLGREGWWEPGPRFPFGWTRQRQLKLPAKKSFADQWKEAAHGKA